MRKITITTLRRTLWVALLVVFSFCTFQAVAGVPRKMAYQIMALDPTTGQVLANREVNIRIELRKDTTNGPAVWYQDFKVQTDEAGVCQLTLELADSISWGTANYYMATIVDGKECGAPQITSVPYALYAQNALQAGSVEGGMTKKDLIGTWWENNGNYKYIFKEDGSGIRTYDLDTNPKEEPFKWVLDNVGHLLVYDLQYYGSSDVGLYTYSVQKLSDTTIAFDDYLFQKQ